MKFTASPLVVAVALGLLGPAALTPDAEEEDAVQDPGVDDVPMPGHEPQPFPAPPR